MLDSRNRPLTQVKVAGNCRFSIHKVIIQKLISLLPEHKLITELKKDLIDELCSERAAINNVFVNTFSSDYAIMHLHLFADKSLNEATSSLDGYDYKAYQIHYTCKENRLNVESIKLSILFKPNAALTSGGFEKFSPVIPLPDKYYICDSLSFGRGDGRGDGHILVVREWEIFGSSVAEFKYDIANQVDFFTSTLYTRNPLKYKKNVTWKPFLRSNETFEVLDIKTIPL